MLGACELSLHDALGHQSSRKVPPNPQRSAFELVQCRALGKMGIEWEIKNGN